MKKSWSRYWKSSKQPRKQRKWRANAPLHVRHKLVSAHLSKELKKQYNRRSIPIRKGDEITIKRGDSKGKSGKVSRVDMKNLKVFMDNLKTKKVSGQEIEVPVEPSNTVITKLNLDDKERIKILQAKKVAERK